MIFINLGAGGFEEEPRRNPRNIKLDNRGFHACDN